MEMNKWLGNGWLAAADDGQSGCMERKNTVNECGDE
jgi:hypothetical protein